MKMLVSLSVLALAISGAVAGAVSSQSKTPHQVATLSHQVILSGMPAPACSPQNCNIRGTN
jgi:hypothetical protein